jgi:hypothetical protein
MNAALPESPSRWPLRRRRSTSELRRSAFRWLGVAILSAMTAAVTGCVDGPREVKSSDVFSSQKKISTLQHWRMIAEVSANDLWRDEYATRDSFCTEHKNWPQADCAKYQITKTEDPKPTPNPTRCVIVQAAPAAGKTQFQAFLESELTTELVRGQQAQVRDPAYGNGIPPESPTCDLASIESIYVRHKVYKATPFPGQYTILASGLVLVRDVARAFNFPRAIGLVAMGEGAFWLGAGLHGHGDMAEIAVTVSRTNSAGLYQRRITNIYYIDERESRLYDGAWNSGTGSYHPPGTHPEPPQYEALDASAAKLVASSLPDVDDCTVQNHVPPCPQPAAPPPSKEPSFGKLQVSPATISNCDTTAGFVVMGSGLMEAKPNYRFGPIVASHVSPVSLITPAQGKDPFQVVQVEFERLQTANRGLDTVPLTAQTANGAATYTVSVKGSCTPSPTNEKNIPVSSVATLAGSWILDVKNSKSGSGRVCTNGSRDYAVTAAGEESMTASITCDQGVSQTVSYTKAKENGPDVAVTDSSGQAVNVSVKRKDSHSTSALYKAKDGKTLWTETCAVAASGKDLTVTLQGPDGSKSLDVLRFHKK